MSYVFASDLHLSPERPEKVALFENLLSTLAGTAEALYILGDLFEIWLGDDDDSASHPEILDAMKTATNAGLKLFVMSGNRDFLISQGFVEATGATLLEDWHVVDLYKTPTLLTHGDLLCTKDVQYQTFRRYVRDKENQRAFLSHPLDERRKIAANTRSGTKASMLEKDDFIMDVEQSTVEKFMREYQVTRLIHGHTHRPNTHTFSLEDVSVERIVLGDWYGECSIVVCNAEGLARINAAEFVNGNH